MAFHRASPARSICYILESRAELTARLADVNTSSERILPTLEPSYGRQGLRTRGALLLEEFRQEESQIDCLLRVQTRIADRMISVIKISVSNSASAAGAFCDVLSCHLQMHAAGIGTFGLMNFEEAADLFHDQIEGPGFVTG